MLRGENASSSSADGAETPVPAESSVSFVLTWAPVVSGLQVPVGVVPTHASAMPTLSRLATVILLI
jgi:hypothetical protein